MKPLRLRIATPPDPVSWPEEGCANLKKTVLTAEAGARGQKRCFSSLYLLLYYHPEANLKRTVLTAEAGARSTPPQPLPSPPSRPLRAVCRLSFHSVSRLSQVGGASSLGSSAAVGGSRGERVRAQSVVITPPRHTVSNAPFQARSTPAWRPNVFSRRLPTCTCRTGLRNRTVQRAMGEKSRWPCQMRVMWHLLFKMAFYTLILLKKIAARP